MADLIFVAYAVAFGASAVVCLGGVGRARQVKAPDVRRGLVGLLVASGGWAAADLVFLLAPGLAWKEALFIGSLTCGFATVWAWLYFCSAYAGRALHRSRAVWYLAGVVYLVVVSLKVTNPMHHLYFVLQRFADPFPHVGVEPRLLYWIVTALAYLLAAGGYALLVPVLERAETGRSALGVLVGLTALPVLLNLVGYGTPLLLEVNHDAIGVAAFAVGVLWVHAESFEDVQRLSVKDEPAVIADETGRIRSFNAPAQALFPALRRTESQGRRLDDVLPEVADAIGSGRYLVQMPRARNGVERDYQITTSRFGAGLTQAGELYVFTDVTAREERRRGRDAQLRGLIDSVPGVVFCLWAHADGSYSVPFLSEAADDLLHLSAETDDLFARFTERVPAPHREELMASVEASVRDHAPWRFEIPYELPEGERRWLLGTSVPDPREDGVAFNGVLIDITPRKEAEQLLQRSEERFRALSEQAVDVVAIFDEAAEIEYVSPSVERVLGASREALTGMDALDLAHPDDREGLRSVFEETLRTGGPAEVAGRYRYQDGPERILSTRARRITGSDGAPKVIASIRDVTDTRRQREELVEAKEAAEEASRLKSALLANMSHEVRTPLTSIIGFSEILSGMDLGERPNQFVELINGSGQRLLDTLNAVLDLSRLEAGAAELNASTVNVATFVEEVAGSLSATAEEGGVDLQVRPPAGSATVNTDRAGLRSILVNLVSNAIKFTGVGGRVVLRARSVEDAGDGGVEFVVEDTGIGMDPAFVEDAFEAFRQESTGDDRAFEGSGLGLAIVDRYTDLLGGTVAIETEQGVGTTVTVRLPATPPESRGGNAGPTEVGTSGGGTPS